MGGEGIGIVVALAFVLCSVIPAINRRRAIIARTVIDERFADELRMLNTQPRTERNSHLRELNLGHTVESEYGRIFYSERKMVGNEAEERNNRKVTTEKVVRKDTSSAIRENARIRAMAKVRIQKRNLLARKIRLLCAISIACTLVFWIAIPVVQLHFAYALGSALISGISVSFSYLIRTKHANLNQVDEKIIRQTSKIINGVNGKQSAKKNSQKIKNMVAINSAQNECKEKKEKSALKEAAIELTNSRIAKKDENYLQKDLVAENSADNFVETKNSSENSQIRKAPKVSVKKASQPISAIPSYTVKPKIQKRRVAPYSAAVVASEAKINVPYRPVRLGERFADTNLEAPNTAPNKANTEEIRADVLAGGSSLDALLERRRA